MFFALSKELGFFALPSNFMAVVGLLGIALLFTRRQRLGRGLMVASLLTLAIAGWTPLGNWLIAPLENRFPPWNGDGTPDGIVVLGGAISPELSLDRHSLALNESAERMTVVADLARRYPAARLVFSGGSGFAALVSVVAAEVRIVVGLLPAGGRIGSGTSPARTSPVKTVTPPRRFNASRTSVSSG